MIARLLLASALVLPAAFVRAESLGEAAEREKQRRKGGSETKTFTEEDLNKGKPTPRPRPTEGSERQGKAAPAPTLEPPPEMTPDPTAGQQAEWRERARNTRDSVESARTQLAHKQAALDDLVSPFHPMFPRGYGNPAVPEARDAVEAAKQRLAAAEQALANLQEEARRAGVPARWVEDDDR